MIQAIRLYRTLVEADPELENEGMEELIGRHDEGKMDSWVLDLDIRLADEED